MTRKISLFGKRGRQASLKDESENQASGTIEKDSEDGRRYLPT